MVHFPKRNSLDSGVTLSIEREQTQAVQTEHMNPEIHHVQSQRWVGSGVVTVLIKAKDKHVFIFCPTSQNRETRAAGVSLSTETACHRLDGKLIFTFIYNLLCRL